MSQYNCIIIIIFSDTKNKIFKDCIDLKYANKIMHNSTDSLRIQDIFVGQLVAAKLSKKYPWWPARVVQKSKHNEIYVKFFDVEN